MVDFDVVDLEPTDHPQEGETAPEFTRPLVNAEYWSDTSLDELTDDGPVALVFFPMDGAFPSTYMWNEIRDRGWGELLTVVGVSTSTPYEHKSFIEEREIEYELFADPQNSVAESYHIVHDLDGMTGVTEPRPAVFLLGDDRTVKYAWVAAEWPDFPDYDEVEREIRSLAG